MKNVLIVKPSALGDIIQATCVLPVLKASFPGIRISWLVFEHNAGIVMNHPLVDRVITLRRKGGFPWTLPRLLHELREPDFDAVIDLQGLLRSALLARLTGCSRRIGFANAREQATLFYTEAHEIPTQSMHAVDGYLRLCKALGAKALDEVFFPLPIGKEHRRRVKELLAGFSEGKPLIAVCPTAKWRSKCWPESRFSELADLLSDRLDARIVLLGSPSEKEITARIAGKVRRPCLDLAGRISIVELAALLEASDLYVGNDSGLMHMASATRTRTVALFGPTDPGRTGPYNPRARVVRADLDCMPCFKRECRNPRCMNEIAPEAVALACEELLAKEGLQTDALSTPASEREAI